MIVDMNVKQLIEEIERAKEWGNNGRGLSVNRVVENGLAHWEVYLGTADPGEMTILCSQFDYREKPSSEIAATIIGNWDALWDDPS